jgi:hypothetical protein
VKKLIAVLLAVGIGTPAFGGDLSSAISKATAEAVAAQARPNARGGNSDDNPLFLPAVLLMAVGGGVALYGITHDTGIECSSTVISCQTTKSTPTIVTGVSMLGVGAFLFYKSRQNSPNILIGPRGISVRQRWTW